MCWDLESSVADHAPGAEPYWLRDCEQHGFRRVICRNVQGNRRRARDKYGRRPLIIDRAQGHFSTSGGGPMLAPTAAHQ